MIRVRVVRRHRRECLGAMHRHGWASGWYLTRDHVMRDVLGRKNGSGTCWLIARCNFSHGCEAEALINEMDVIDALTQTGQLPMESVR